MLDSADIIRRRQRRRKRRSHNNLRKTRRGALVLFSILSLALGVMAIFLAVAYDDLTRDLPPLNQIAVMMDSEDGMLASPTVILDRTGRETLAVLGERTQDRAYLSLNTGGGAGPAADLVDATIAAADPGFWQHAGFHAETLLSTDPDTISTKLVSELLFWDEAPGVRRSLREKLLAAQITAEYGREQVLEWYLNSAHYGEMAFGAEAAARLYFGKSAARLTRAEAAVLAAVSQAPDLNPFDTPDLALTRRDAVLGKMLELGYITEEEAAASLSEPLGARPARPPDATATTAFTQFVQSQLDPFIPAEILARGGLTVITTLDFDLQAEMVCTLEVQLARISSGSSSVPEDCAAARLLPSLAGANQPGPGLAGEVVAIDPTSGQILALVAIDAEVGPSPERGVHPPGSILTPYIYLAAFTHGLSPASLVWDIPANLVSGQSGSPNLDGSFHGPMRIRTSMASDYLVPALQLLTQFDAASVWNSAALSGLPSLADQAGMLVLKGGALSLVEAVHAYSAFSTQGVLIGYIDPDSPLNPTPLQPTGVLRVTDNGGRIWLDLGPPQARPVMSAPLAYSLTNILSDESARWPAFGHPNALEVGRPAGVKTGFTQDRQNAWTIGFTPQISIGVWVGFYGSSSGPAGDSVPIGQLEPGAAAGVWHAALTYAARDLPPDGWSLPQGIQEIEVCDPSGLLPTPECPVVVREIFLTGSEPVHPDNLYRKFEINRETGLLATIFTPQSLIEEHVFLVPPPEAITWAQQSGLDIPPENYDLVSQPPPASHDAQITGPAMFGYLGGEIEISGSASGEGFQSFSVQVGQGLNPQQWLQLGDISTTPVRNGRLAVWDTQGLSGLYAIRLSVVLEDNLLETHIIQVTVDNQPPQVDILYPAAGQTFSYPAEATVTVQLTASDDLFLAGVDVYLDDRFVRTLNQPPFALALSLPPGEHTLRVKGYDLAGNVFEVERTILVTR